MSKAVPVAKSGSKSKKKGSQRDQTTLVLVVAVAVVAFLVLMGVVLSQLNNSSAPKGAYSEMAQLTTSDGAPILGDPRAPVVFREFSNFACPHCMEYRPVIHQVIDKYVATGQARLEVRVMVWDRPGPNSMNAGFAAMCAAQEGHFWDLHDALFNALETTGSQAYEIPNIRDLANGVGANGDKIADCVLNKGSQTEIATNAQLAQQVGMTGTPALMYSTDGGQTFKWFTVTGADGKAVEYTGGGPTMTAFDQIIADAYSQ